MPAARPRSRDGCHRRGAGRGAPQSATRKAPSNPTRRALWRPRTSHPRRRRSRRWHPSPNLSAEPVPEPEPEVSADATEAAPEPEPELTGAAARQLRRRARIRARAASKERRVTMHRLVSFFRRLYRGETNIRVHQEQPPLVHRLRHLDRPVHHRDGGARVQPRHRVRGRQPVHRRHLRHQHHQHRRGERHRIDRHPGAGRRPRRLGPRPRAGSWCVLRDLNTVQINRASGRAQQPPSGSRSARHR